jgi:hypothetical protein
MRSAPVQEIIASDQINRKTTGSGRSQRGQPSGAGLGVPNPLPASLELIGYEIWITQRRKCAIHDCAYGRWEAAVLPLNFTRNETNLTLAVDGRLNLLSKCSKPIHDLRGDERGLFAVRKCPASGISANCDRSE